MFEMPMADRISTLPDDVLCHILSFLPTEEVVFTSVLSKRWRTLWLSVLSLDFDEDRFAINDKPYSDFSMFINRTILARDVRLPIRRFILKCLCWCGSYDMLDSDVNGWVNNAIQRGVENLDIDMYLPHRILYLKGCIFTCRTLVVLKLGGLTVESLSSICLPSLKKLQLVDATFFGPQNLRTLLTGCPNLEDLEARDIHFNDHGDSGEWRSLPMLVKAHIYHVDVNIPSKAISNVQWLCIDKLDEVILVFTNLTHLELLYGTHMNWRQVHAVLNQCPKLKKFDLYLLRSPIGFVWPFPRLDPQCFSSHLDKCSIINYKGTEYELQFVKFILQRARVLRTMIIYTLPSCDQDELLEELSLWPRTSTTCELVIE